MIVDNDEHGSKNDHRRHDRCGDVDAHGDGYSTDKDHVRNTAMTTLPILAGSIFKSSECLDAGAGAIAGAGTVSVAVAAAAAAAAAAIMVVAVVVLLFCCCCCWCCCCGTCCGCSCCFLSLSLVLPLSLLLLLPFLLLLLLLLLLLPLLLSLRWSLVAAMGGYGDSDQTDIDTATDPSADNEYSHVGGEDDHGAKQSGLLAHLAIGVFLQHMPRNIVCYLEGLSLRV